MTIHENAFADYRNRVGDQSIPHADTRTPYPFLLSTTAETLGLISNCPVDVYTALLSRMLTDV